MVSVIANWPGEETGCICLAGTVQGTERVIRRHLEPGPFPQTVVVMVIKALSGNDDDDSKDGDEQL